MCQRLCSMLPVQLSWNPQLKILHRMCLRQSLSATSAAWQHSHCSQLNHLSHSSSRQLGEKQALDNAAKEAAVLRDKFDRSLGSTFEYFALKLGTLHVSHMFVLLDAEAVRCLVAFVRAPKDIARLYGHHAFWKFSWNFIYSGNANALHLQNCSCSAWSAHIYRVDVDEVSGQSCCSNSPPDEICLEQCLGQKSRTSSSLLSP